MCDAKVDVIRNNLKKLRESHKNHQKGVFMYFPISLIIILFNGCIFFFEWPQNLIN